MAVSASGLVVGPDNATRVGVIIGSGIGGFEVIEREHRVLLEKGPDRVSPFFILSSIVNLAAGQVSVRLGAKGPNSAVATACTTGAHAIGDGFRLVQRGYADAMICGGTEASITPLGIAGFAAMRALSTRNDAPERGQPSVGHRPRRLRRRRRGGHPGAGRAHGGRAPRRADPRRARRVRDERRRASPHGAAGRRRRRRARDDAGARGRGPVAWSDPGTSNAHATSTPLGDRAEAIAIARVFGAARRRASRSARPSR